MTSSGAELSHVPGRGGDQRIPRPSGHQPGGPPPWSTIPESDRPFDVEQLGRSLRDAGAPAAAQIERSGARRSAVLAPLFVERGELWVVLTRRAKHLRSHRGEVSFPGGGVEGSETLVEAALRESFEEVALEPSAVSVVGEIDHLETYSSRSVIVPFVGLIEGRPDLTPNPEEVEAVLYVPVRELLLDEVYREEFWGLAPLDRPLYFFELVGDTVWGATASMLRNLLALGTGTSWR